MSDTRPVVPNTTLGRITSAEAIGADQAAREMATDPRRSILLQAPAGSGKTSVLTQRLLRLLAEVQEPEEILAITFTRKAAAEMRARVVKALRGQIDSHAAQGRRLRELATAALERAAARGWNLADDPGRLRIQTIDAFNFRLASQLPVTARAGAALVVAERPRDLYQRAARRTLVDAENDPALVADAELLFTRLDNNWRKVEQLLERMLQQRGHWLRYVLGNEPGALCARITASLTNILHDHLALLCRNIPAGLRRQAAALPNVGALEADIESFSSWQRLMGLCMTRQGDWRKPRGVSRALGPAFDEDTRQSLKDCIEHLRAIPSAQQLLQELASLPDATLAQDDVDAVAALTRLLRSAAAHLQAEFALTGRVDHTYVSGAARAALTDAGEPTDLALQAGLQLRHILVDEFQDTSLAQFDLIETLTAAWEESDGRTLFVVGDPMQSIYQFREAEVGLFLRARDHRVGTVILQPLRLTRNFRSVPALVEWTNAAFASLFPAVDDLRASAVAFTPSLGARSDLPAPQHQPVRLQLFPGSDRAAEAAAVAQHIVAIRRDEPVATIAVLVASRSHAVPILSALDDREVAAIGVDLVPLGEVAVVRDLVALLRALHHLGDRTAWLAVLRAPWCGVRLATLTAISERGSSRSVWEAMCDPERLAACTAEDCVRLERVRDVLQTALLTRGRAHLADWLERTWLQLGSADAYGAQDLEHGRAFLAALSGRSAAGEWSGPQDIPALLQDLFAQSQPQAANPVQIMTIHRAKGLEFDHVFVPGLDRELAREHAPLLRWLDLPRPHGPSDLILAPAPVIGAEEGGEVGRYLKRLIARRETNERARLLYVAATRARQTLSLSGAPKVKPDGTVIRRQGTLLETLWPLFASGFETAAPARAAATSRPPDTEPAATYAANADATPQIRQIPIALRLGRLRAAWAPPPLPQAPQITHLPLAQQSLEPQLEFSWVQETSRSIGTLVHAALASFALEEELPACAAIEARRVDYARLLTRQGVPESQLSRAVQVVVDALTRTVSDPTGRWIFSRQHRDAHSELALTGMAAGRLINVVIDRSFVDADGTRWVLDFKTGDHQGGGRQEFLDSELTRYRSQLARYVELAGSLGPEPVRAALYFPLLGALREAG